MKYKPLINHVFNKSKVKISIDDLYTLAHVIHTCIVCVHVCTYVCVYTYVRVCLCVYTHTHTFKHMS